MSRQGNNHLGVLAVDNKQYILNLYQEIFSKIHYATESVCEIKKLDANSKLSDPSFDLKLCRKGEEAVEAAKAAIKENHPFALAFLDFNESSENDGLWAAETIRKLDPSIELVLVTSYLNRDLGEIARRIPPSHKMLYLQKPFYIRDIWQIALALGAKWQMERHHIRIQKESQRIIKVLAHEQLKIKKQLENEIKKRARAENSLLEIKDNFLKLMTHDSDSIIILDRNGVMRFINPATESLFGRKPDTMIGELFGLPVTVDGTTELDVIKKDGKTAVAEMHVTETEWEGEEAYFASLRDISHQKRMEGQIEQSIQKLEKVMKGTIKAMASAIEMKDPYTAGHQLRVACLAKAIAEKIGLSQNRTDGVYMAALIHDLGKISVPSEILSKTGRLTDAEFSIIKNHSQIGHDILKPIEFPWPVATMVLQHHERISGVGYPHGLSGRDLLLESKILAVADVIEAMSSHRPYRAALGTHKALEEISQKKGIFYDPSVVDACIFIFKNNIFSFEKVNNLLLPKYGFISRH